MLASMHKNIRSLILVGLLGVLLLGSSARAAEESYTFTINKKQEEKAKTRWSLQEWLATKERMKAMDLWLALHSPSPYEFIFGLNTQFANLPGAANAQPWGFSGTMHASIFGLGGEYEASPIDTRWAAAFYLRVFGMYYQSTNITLQFGLRNTTQGAVTFRNPMAGGVLSIYLGKYFGLNGLFRHFFGATPNASGLAYVGDRWEGGAFIDFSVLRVGVDYFSERAEGQSRTGMILGGKLFL